MYLTMLGTGNGFIPGQMDSNALLEENGCKTLIDCGTTAWQSLEVLGVPREDIDAILSPTFTLITLGIGVHCSVQ